MLRSGNRYQDVDEHVAITQTANESVRQERKYKVEDASGSSDFSGAMDSASPRAARKGSGDTPLQIERKDEEKVDEEHEHVSPHFNVEIIKSVILINAFLYAVCYWIQVGVLPYLTKKLGVDMITFGYLQTVCSLAALIGGPIYGRFGDVYGGRAALALAYTAAVVFYGLLSIANTVALVFISRIPSLFLHSFHGTQMVISDLTDEAGRTDALGKVSMFYSIGIVVGPLIGGWISVYVSEQSAAAVACIGSCFSLALVLLFIPANTKPTQATHGHKDRSPSSNLFSIQRFTHLVRSSPSAAFFLSVNLLAGLPPAILSSMQAVMVLEMFELTADESGYFLSFQGIISIVVQGVIIGQLTQRLSEMKLLRGSAVLLIASYLSLALVQNVWHLVAVMLPMTCANCVVTTVITSVLTKSVPASESGTILGLSYAGISFVGTIAPIVGAQLLTHFGLPSLGVVGAAFNAVLLIILTRY